MTLIIKKIKETGRDRLIASALKLFCDRGYHGVSVREICDCANANPSLISFHFGGKEGLLDTLFQSFTPEEFDEIEKILSSVDNAVDLKIRLNLFFKSYVDFYLKNSEVVSLYFDELEKEHAFAVEILPKTFGKLWNRLVIFLQEAQDKKIIHSEVDVKILAYSMISPLGSSMRSKRSTHLFSKFTINDSDFIDRLITQMVDTIKLA